jgi:hypothetical protein
MRNDLRTRRGLIRVHRDILFKSGTEILSLFFSKFYPVHIEVVFDVYVYTGMSEYFEQISEGTPTPLYEATFTETSEGLTLKFTKI